jgi:hypothetical protein
MGADLLRRREPISFRALRQASGRRRAPRRQLRLAGHDRARRAEPSVDGVLRREAVANQISSGSTSSRSSRPAGAPNRSKLLPFRSVPEEPHPTDIAFDPDILRDTAYSRLLAAIDDYQDSELFTSTRANFLVLQHIKEFKSWWTLCDQNSETLNARIRKLFNRPNDWPTLSDTKLQHAVRLELPAPARPERWADSVQEWIGSSRQHET